MDKGIALTGIVPCRIVYGRTAVFREQTQDKILGTLLASNGALVTVWHDDHEVDVAVFVRRAPGAGSEEVDLLRMEFGLQPRDEILQPIVLNALHGTNPNNSGLRLEVRFDVPFIAIPKGTEGLMVDTKSTVVIGDSVDLGSILVGPQEVVSPESFVDISYS